MDQRAAAHGQLFLVQRIEALAALLVHQDKIGLFQLLQVVTDRRLVDSAAELLHHIIHSQPHASQVFHNLLARVVGKGFRENYRIYTHHGLIISKFINMSRGFIAPDPYPTGRRR